MALARSPRAWALVVAAVLLLWGELRMLGPMLARWDTYGFHDWDAATAYRHITTVALLEYGELPWWNPWLCGGFPAFGYVEGATNLVSPYLPLYLLLDVRAAIRIEVLGATATALAGAYLLASRFTRSVALAALVAALFALNGRWAFQLGTGHTWHLQFCWLPWALWAFDLAQDPGRGRSAILAGAFVALTALLGGIYPLPYTALFLTGYALLLAVGRASLRPLGRLAVAGGVAAGLAAPKLWPVVDTMASAPRIIESREVIGLGDLVVMLTERGQRYGAFPVRVPAYNWHEWALYVGALPLAALVLGALFARGPRAQAIRLLGLLAWLLGLGAFHPHSPWALLHRAPIFSSLHVPSRFHLVMVLLLAVSFAAWVGERLDRALRRSPWLDLLLLLPVGAIVADLGREARGGVAHAFWMQAPDAIARAPAFEHRRLPTVEYVRRDWAKPVLLPMLANQGVVECYGIPESFPVGAIPVEDPRYRGMAEVADGPGEATVTEWSPNRALVEVRGAEPGALVVYDMNYERSWRAEGAPALEHERRVAARLRPGATTIEFHYRPRRLGAGLLVCLATSGAIVFGLRRFRGARAPGPGPRAPGSTPDT